MYFRGGGKAQWLRALAALPKVLSSNPSKHKVDHYHLSWDPMSFSSVSEERDIIHEINK